MARCQDHGGRQPLRRNNVRAYASAFVVIWLAVGALPTLASASERPPNVLMIWVDDLRPEMTPYGVAGLETPALDRLAARSLRFDRAYCNVPVCGASRASVMTGLRATPTRFVDYDTRVDVDTPDAVTLQQLLRTSGYHTAFFGKILHFSDDAADGWEEGADYYDWPGYTTVESQKIYRERQASAGWRTNGPAWEVADVNDDDLSDGRIANAACEAIGRLANQDRPFFIAAGFFKPHLPFVAPKRYWKPYTADTNRLPANFRTRPDAPTVAFSNWGELRSYHGMPAEGPVDASTAAQLVAAYHACVSYADAQIGRILDRLDESGVGDQTIIVLLGDHGWNLGDHGMWCKHCCFETSMRTPLFVSAPALSGFRPGVATRAITEFVDIYPSLCELADIEAPAGLQGTSFASVLRDPTASHRDSAIGRFKAGDTIRNDRYRYSLYRSGERVLGEMLYDHHEDPHEDTNLADDDQHLEVLRELREQLAASFAE